jgi:hypothetical protein
VHGVEVGDRHVVLARDALQLADAVGLGQVLEVFDLLREAELLVAALLGLLEPLHVGLALLVDTTGDAGNRAHRRVSFPRRQLLDLGHALLHRGREDARVVRVAEALLAVEPGRHDLARVLARLRHHLLQLRDALIGGKVLDPLHARRDARVGVGRLGRAVVHHHGQVGLQAVVLALGCVALELTRRREQCAELADLGAVDPLATQRLDARALGRVHRGELGRIEALEQGDDGVVVDEGVVELVEQLLRDRCDVVLVDLVVLDLGAGGVVVTRSHGHVVELGLCVPEALAQLVELRACGQDGAQHAGVEPRRGLVDDGLALEDPHHVRRRHLHGLGLLLQECIGLATLGPAAGHVELLGRLVHHPNALVGRAHGCATIIEAERRTHTVERACIVEQA